MAIQLGMERMPDISPEQTNEPYQEEVHNNQVEGSCYSIRLQEVSALPTWKSDHVL